MIIDPQVQTLLDAAAGAARTPVNKLAPVEARVQFKELRKALLPPTPEIGSVVDSTVSGRRGAIPVRHYRPLGKASNDVLPVLIYFHGGGWVVGDLDTHDALCRQLANAGACAVISVDYRMGPEQKFPAAVDDAEDVVRFVAASGTQLKIDATRIAVGGDSAGGNLATVIAMICRDSGGPALKFQLLIYPATDMAMEHPSHYSLAEGYNLTRDMMLYFRHHYLNNVAENKDWRASPLLAKNHANLPAAYILTAGFDPLRDEGKDFAHKLTAAGVAVRYHCYEGMIHGFITMSGVLRVANEAVADCGNELRAHLS